MACSTVLQAVDDDNVQDDTVADEAASCELMLEALQDHLKSIEVRINLPY